MTLSLSPSPSPPGGVAVTGAIDYRVRTNLTSRYRRFLGNRVSGSPGRIYCSRQNWIGSPPSLLPPPPPPLRSAILRDHNPRSRARLKFLRVPSNRVRNFSSAGTLRIFQLSKLLPSSPHNITYATGKLAVTISLSFSFFLFFFPRSISVCRVC